MLASNARLAANIKSEINFNPYPHHLAVTPRDGRGEALVIKREITDHEVSKMYPAFFVSERPEDGGMGAAQKQRFTNLMYAQPHKRMSTVQEMGKDPFRLGPEEMLKIQMEQKYASKYVGPCFDMGAIPNWKYNSYHGGTDNC